MLRNPWTDWSPVVKMMENPETRGFVLGFTGKIISLMWTLGQILFFIYGFILLKRMGRVVTQAAWIGFLSVIASWLISIGTVGDHRFRIPTMVFSLIFQISTFMHLREKIVKAL
jgi:hypothetical protein